MGTAMVMFKRSADEAATDFGSRLHGEAVSLLGLDTVSTVVLFVDDGEVGAPAGAAALPSTFSGAILVSAGEDTAIPRGDARYDVRRRVIKSRERPAGGRRSPGFTIVCPSVRAPFLDHDQFDAHWRDRHSKIHVASSPATCHYEQLIVDRVATRGAPEWDGIGLLSVASAADHRERFFGSPEDADAVRTDITRFLDLSRGETLPSSEYVYRDRWSPEAEGE